MSYLQSVMIDGEKLEYRARISPWYFLPDYAGMLASLCIASMSGGLMSGLMGMVFLFLAARAAILYYCTELAITNRRVIVKIGFISRYTVEINLDRIESINIAQSIIGRILNYGTVMVNGTGSGHAPIRGIQAPLTFRKKYNEILAKT